MFLIRSQTSFILPSMSNSTPSSLPPRAATPPEFTGIQENRRRGRGAVSNQTGRFESHISSLSDDGWGSLDQLEPFKTEVFTERPSKIISQNNSPDIKFDRSINPYRGCEHGCVYCYARPSHTYLGLSAGLDFESKLFVKQNAAGLLERELAAKGYKPQTIALGANTDIYQPIERQYRVTRSILEALDRANHPVGLITKSALIVRDIDILSSMAKRGLVKAAISVTTLDRKLARAMEPRATTPEKRIETIRLLSEAGIPTAVVVAPIIPALNDPELETILKRAKAAGAREAGYVILRLPHELRALFREWLKTHYPDREDHVFSLLRSMRGGKENDTAWGRRMKGSGPYAWQIGRRFEIMTKRLGLNDHKFELRTDLFAPPVLAGQPMRLL